MQRNTTTYVVNYEPCEEDYKGKGTLEEVHTYAELKNDPRDDLPSSFTICSSVMTTYGTSGHICCLTCWEKTEINGWDQLPELMMTTHPSIMGGGQK